MGASTFATVQQADTMDEAYRGAVDDAFYWHGHGGYTGTIAEKDGFVAFTIPIDKFPTTNAGELTEMIGAALNWLHDQRHYDDPFDAPESEYSWEMKARRDAKILAEAMPMRDLKHMREVYNDKWGPAVGFALEDKKFAFIGWASC